MIHLVTHLARLVEANTATTVTPEQAMATWHEVHALLAGPVAEKRRRAGAGRQGRYTAPGSALPGASNWGTVTNTYPRSLSASMIPGTAGTVPG